jgi:putative transposase
LSTGEQVEHPRYLRNSLTKLARLQKKMERKVKGSKNRWKAKMQVALKHAEVANQRKGFLHRLTSDLASRFDRIVVEDLCVAGMVQTRLAKSISDSGWGEFRKMLSYKAKELAVADRWFPSSKLCSCCNFKLETLPLSCRSWTCPECETVHDRDRNAAVNLERYNTPLSGLSWPRLSAEASCA